MTMNPAMMQYLMAMQSQAPQQQMGNPGMARMQALAGAQPQQQSPYTAGPQPSQYNYYPGNPYIQHVPGLDSPLKPKAEETTATTTDPNAGVREQGSYGGADAGGGHMDSSPPSPGSGNFRADLSDFKSALADLVSGASSSGSQKSGRTEGSYASSVGAPGEATDPNAGAGLGAASTGSTGTEGNGPDPGAYADGGEIAPEDVQEPGAEVQAGPGDTGAVSANPGEYVLSPKQIDVLGQMLRLAGPDLVHLLDQIKSAQPQQSGPGAPAMGEPQQPSPTQPPAPQKPPQQQFPPQ